MSENEQRKEALKRFQLLENDLAPANLTCPECKTTYKAEYLAVKCKNLDIDIAKEKANK